MAGFIITRDGVSQTAGTVGADAQAAAARARRRQMDYIEERDARRLAAYGTTELAANPMDGLNGNGMNRDGTQRAASSTAAPVPVAGDRPVNSAALDAVDTVYEVPQMPGQPQSGLSLGGINPLTAALLTRGNGTASSVPVQTAVQETGSAPAVNAGGAILPLIGLAGMFLL